VGEEPEDFANQEPPPEALEAEELQFGKAKRKKRTQESDSQMQVGLRAYMGGRLQFLGKAVGLGTLVEG